MNGKSLVVRCGLAGTGLYLIISMISAGPLPKDQAEGIYQLALEFDFDEGTKERWHQLQAVLESSARALLEKEGFTLEASSEANRHGHPIVRISLGVLESERCESSATALLRIQLLSQVTVKRVATKFLLGTQNVPVWTRTLHFEIAADNALPRIEMTLHRYLLELSMDVNSANMGATQLEDFNRWKSSKPHEPPN